jgi:hypothetical protein
MGEAQDRLTAKLAREYVAPYMRDGQRVGGYYRESSGRSKFLETAKRTLVRQATPSPSTMAKPPPAARSRKETTPSKGEQASSPEGEVEKPEKVVEEKGGDGTKENPIKTDDVDEAAKLLGEGKWVRLTQERQVSTLLDKLAEIVEDARSHGDNPPDYDLCRVSVEGTNLFCTESKGIPRVKMPQFSGVPKPGSKADHFPKNAKGKVDLSAEFAKHLQKQGIGYQETQINAEFLKASQNQLNGEKVAGIANAFEAKAISPDDEPIWVSSDDYVVDGHHRWAAAVAYGIERGQDVDLSVRQVDSDIITVLDMANKWTADMGIPQADVTKLTGVVMGEKVMKLAKSYVAPHIRATPEGGTTKVAGYWRSLDLGSRVEVQHEQGVEAGTVTSVQDEFLRRADGSIYGKIPLGAGGRRVTVRFDDGTVSSWPESSIVSVGGEARTGQKAPKRGRGISAEVAARVGGPSPWAAADDPVRESRFKKRAGLTNESPIAKLARVFVGPHVRMYEDEPVMVSGYYRDVNFQSETFEPTLAVKKSAGDLRLGDVITDPNGYSGLVTSVNRWQQNVEVSVDYGPDRVRGTGRRESFRMPSSMAVSVIGKFDVSGGREMAQHRDLRGFDPDIGDVRIPSEISPLEAWRIRTQDPLEGWR